MGKYDDENAAFRTRLEASGLKMSVLSRQTGIPWRTIQDWARGERNVQSAAAGALKPVAEAFGCTIEDLL
jgi:DNA-binding transcriptional regulator YiaG